MSDPHQLNMNELMENNQLNYIPNVTEKSELWPKDAASFRSEIGLWQKTQIES